MSQSSKFWDKIAEKYSRRPIADEASYRKKLATTREYFEPGMRVLEFGCGTGSTAIAHAPHVAHIHAIDVSSKMLEIARGKAQAANVGNLTFEQATIEEYQAVEPFDVVLGLSILHLVEDKDAVISKVYGLLEPGGVFVSSTACIGDSLRFLKVVFPVARFLGLIPFVDVFTTAELVASLEAAGFSIDRQWQPGKNKAVFIVAKKPG